MLKLGPALTYAFPRTAVKHTQSPEVVFPRIWKFRRKWIASNLHVTIFRCSGHTATIGLELTIKHAMSGHSQLK